MTDVARTELQRRIVDLETRFDSNVLGFVGPIVFGVDGLVRRAIEAIPAPERRARLLVVIDTPGGVVEVVERMVDTIRHHYPDEVAFAIPDRAMSAGTIFALSGDRILMDYFSVLGPIDPQIEKDGRLIPAQAYVDEFDRLIALAANGRLTTAEIVLLQKLDLGELQQFREAKELSLDLLRKWLVQFKFKDWAVTEGKNLPVTLAMKAKRAEDIAKKLSDAGRWHSHGRGISMATLVSDDIGLRIEDFGAKAEDSAALRGYLLLLRDFMRQQELRNFVHTKHHF